MRVSRHSANVGFMDATPIGYLFMRSVAEPVALVLLLALCTAYLVDGSFNPFLYFRF